jgi:hypothetical protein
MVVYASLLFPAHFVQAGGQDKITQIRQESCRLLFHQEYHERVPAFHQLPTGESIPGAGIRALNRSASLS